MYRKESFAKEYEDYDNLLIYLGLDDVIESPPKTEDMFVDEYKSPLLPCVR